MKNRLFYTFGLIVFVMVAFATSSAEAGGVIGPYYATPSWDQQLACDAPSRCPRFKVLSNWNNEAVLDKETGLVWEQSPSTITFTWELAQHHCNTLVVGDRMGWRLPTVQELASLVDLSVYPGPFLPAGHPFSNVQSAPYWPTTLAFDSSYAWYVHFGNGAMGRVFGFESVNDYFVWCVRGGQGSFQ
jgi:hypothetical protein